MRPTPLLFLLCSLLYLSGPLGAQSLFPIKKDKKWGLINAEGRIVKQPVYDAIGEFKEFGYAIMQRNGKVGIINSEGLETVPPRYLDVKVLDSTLISVMEEAAWQVIDLEGRVILPPGYERVEVLLPAAKGPTLLAFSIGGKWGIVNGKGLTIAAPKYDEITVLENVPETVVQRFFQTKKADRFGLLLPSGLELLPPEVDDIRVYSDNLVFFKKATGWGAIDGLGMQVLLPVYSHFAKLSENFVKLVSDNQDYLFSMVSNRLVSEQPYEAFYPFSEDYVLCKKHRLLGLLDHCGELVLAPKYNEIQPYDGDLFRANLGGRWGIVTMDDLTVIGFEYDYIAPMRNGLCVVIRNRQLGVANHRGEVVVPPNYERLELEDRKAKGYRGGRLTLFHFNDDGRLADEANFGNHFTVKIVREGNQRPLFNGQTTSPYQLEKFEWFYSPKHDKWGLRRLDNGEVQIEPSFHEVQVEHEVGLTLVGIEMMLASKFDRTSYRFEMAYGIVQNDTGLLVHEVDLVDVRMQDFDQGLPLARCIFANGKHGLVSRIGKIIRRDLAYVGEFENGLARVSPKGRTSATLDGSSNHLGRLREHFQKQMAPVTLTDYTQYDYDIDRMGFLTCEGCTWGYLDTLGELAVTPQFSFARNFVNDVGIVANGEKWGMVDAKGKVLLPCRYDELGFLEKTDNKILRIFKKEQKYGLIDTLGRLAVGVQYEEIGSFGEGRLAVKRQGRWGFVDANGREVVPCRFDAVGTFSEGWAAARLGSKWGYIDKNGNTELDFQFSAVGEFHDGLAPAKREGPKFGYIDRTGAWAIQPAFPQADDFDRGVAMVKTEVNDGYRYGLIDRQGNFVVRPKFISMTKFDQHGLAVAELGGNPARYGLLNLEGQLISSQSFRSIEPFWEGLARVRSKDGFGFINLQGSLVIPAKFSKASDFAEGRAAVWMEGRCGFIDREGKLVVGAEYSRCMDFKDGKAIVFRGNQRAGLIDPMGNFIIEPGINRLLDFAEGRGLVRDEHYKFYYITEDAHFYDGTYDRAREFRHGVAVVQVEGRWAIINQQGIEIIPPKYDKIEQFENGYAKVRIQGFSGLTNLQGEMIVQPDYEYISYAGEGLFRVEQGDKVGYFDAEGNCVWGLQE